jgi:hypothetical protein
MAAVSINFPDGELSTPATAQDSRRPIIALYDRRLKARETAG